MRKITDEDTGEEIEVYTAAEVQAEKDTAIAAKEAEFAPIKTKLETDLGEARTSLSARAGEFAQFRKLSDEQIKKLDEKDRIIYENGLALQQEREKSANTEKARIDGLVEATLRGKAGTDEKLFTKMKSMWDVIGIEATTPEAAEAKAKMIIGAIGATEPDLVASLGSFSGGFQPPAAKKEEEKSYADSDQGKAAANELGLLTEPPKKA